MELESTPRNFRHDSLEAPGSSWRRTWTPPRRRLRTRGRSFWIHASNGGAVKGGVTLSKLQTGPWAKRGGCPAFLWLLFVLLTGKTHHPTPSHPTPPHPTPPHPSPPHPTPPHPTPPHPFPPHFLPRRRLSTSGNSASVGQDPGHRGLVPVVEPKALVDAHALVLGRPQTDVQCPRPSSGNFHSATSMCVLAPWKKNEHIWPVVKLIPSENQQGKIQQIPFSKSRSTSREVRISWYYFFCRFQQGNPPPKKGERKGYWGT